MKLIAAIAIVFAAAVEAAPIRKRNLAQHRSSNNAGERQVEEEFNRYLGIEDRRLDESDLSSMSMSMSMPAPTTNDVNAGAPSLSPVTVCGGGVCDLYELASGAADFSTLLTAIVAAGLNDTLSDDWPLAIFAPTNKAFEKLPEDLLTFLLDPENVDQLTKILNYHVVVGTTVPIEAAVEETRNKGESLTIQIFSTGIRVNDANVVDPYNLVATNGVIHAIDSVLIPSNVDLPSYTSSPVTSAPTKKPSSAPTLPTPVPPVDESSEPEAPTSSTKAPWMSRVVVVLIGTALVVF